MLYLLISIIGILFTIFFVIGTHEYAHFITARLLGVKVLRYSIGFGKTLWRWTDKQGTEYLLALFPLGGYVKMLDENEGPVPEKELRYAFNRQPFYKKFLIVLAGPAMNILCALILYWLIYMIGFTTVKPITGKISPHSIAYDAGMQSNQEILSIDHKKTPTWPSVMFRLLVHAGNHDHVNIETYDAKNKKTQTHALDLSNWQMGELTPDPLTSLGIHPFEPEIPLIIGVIAAKSPALGSNLRIGDKIISINQKPIKKWDELITFINQHPNETVMMSLKRNGKTSQIPVKIGSKSNWFKSMGYLGIAPKFELPKSYLHLIQYDPFTALVHASQEIVDFTYFNLLIFGKMLVGKISLQSLGGPITIFETAGSALNYGFLPFIGFLAFLSVSLGVINLLPIPGLDGGHLFFQTIEFLIRRPIPEQLLLLFYRLGFLLLILVLIQALVNDVLRLF